MLRPTTTVRPTTKPAVRTRRPPDKYLDLLTRTEESFRAYIHELEGSPLFEELRKAGIITPLRFGARMPREKYQEYMDQRLVEFLRTTGIADHPDWERDLTAPAATYHVETLARKYDVPVGELARFVRYLASTLQETGYDQGRRRIKEALNLEAGPPPLEQAPDSGDVDLTDIIDVTRAFVEKYRLTEHEFIENVLCGALTAEDLVQTYGCTLAEADGLLAATQRVQVMDVLESQTRPAPIPTQIATGESRVVARVDVDGEGHLHLHFSCESAYIQRYRIDMQRLTAMADKDEQMQDLVARARLVNQRLSTLTRMVHALCEHQQRYLQTGDPEDLKPLSQADLARRIGEHQSTVCRLLRDKRIDTPHGRLELSYFCQSKAEVIRRLVLRHEDLPDRDIQRILSEQYDCDIARRTVAYHRNRRVGYRLRPDARQTSAAQR